MVIPTNQPIDQQGIYSAICLYEGWKIKAEIAIKVVKRKGESSYVLVKVLT